MREDAVSDDERDPQVPDTVEGLVNELRNQDADTARLAGSIAGAFYEGALAETGDVGVAVTLYGAWLAEALRDDEDDEDGEQE